MSIMIFSSVANLTHHPLVKGNLKSRRVKIKKIQENAYCVPKLCDTKIAADSYLARDMDKSRKLETIRLKTASKPTF